MNELAKRTLLSSGLGIPMDSELSRLSATEPSIFIGAIDLPEIQGRRDRIVGDEPGGLGFPHCTRDLLLTTYYYYTSM